MYFVKKFSIKKLIDWLTCKFSKNVFFSIELTCTTSVTTCAMSESLGAKKSATTSVHFDHSRTRQQWDAGIKAYVISVQYLLRLVFHSTIIKKKTWYSYCTWKCSFTQKSHSLWLLPTMGKHLSGEKLLPRISGEKTRLHFMASPGSWVVSELVFNKNLKHISTAASSPYS